MPIRNLLSISGETIATQSLGCPSMNATKTSITQGFGCADGEVLRGGKDDSLPECCNQFVYLLNTEHYCFMVNSALLSFLVPCPKGTVNVNNTCEICPLGSYQDERAQTSCKPCPDQTYTQFPGSHSVNACLRKFLVLNFAI